MISIVVVIILIAVSIAFARCLIIFDQKTILWQFITNGIRFIRAIIKMLCVAFLMRALIQACFEIIFELNNANICANVPTFMYVTEVNSFSELFTYRVSVDLFILEHFRGCKIIGYIFNMIGIIVLTLVKFMITYVLFTLMDMVL